jgi:hypothetical protein
LREARPRLPVSHYLQRMTAPPFQHIHHPPHRCGDIGRLPTQSFRPSSDDYRHLTTLFSIGSRADRLGLSRRSPAYTPFPWTTSSSSSGTTTPIRDEMIQSPSPALWSPANEELRYWVTPEQICSWREGRSPHRTRTWRPSTPPRSLYTDPHYQSTRHPS